MIYDLPGLEVTLVIIAPNYDGISLLMISRLVDG